MQAVGIVGKVSSGGEGSVEVCQHGLVPSPLSSVPDQETMDPADRPLPLAFRHQNPAGESCLELFGFAVWLSRLGLWSEGRQFESQYQQSDFTVGP